MNNRTRNDHLLVIKVGGSFITNKTKPFTTLPNSISLFASELSNLRDTYPNIDFLIGNGAGSFAHFSAHKYGLSQGANTAEQLYGLCLAHNGVRKLNSMLTDALTASGLPAFGLSPSSLFMSKDGEIVTEYFDPVRHLLAEGLIPVLHGDTILDVTSGTKIYSTEKIIQECVERLRAQYAKITVIYLLSVNGVLDKDGATIPLLKPNDDTFVYERLKHDVTGGIVGKIESARKVAKIADEVFLINGNIPGELRKVIATGTAGTMIEHVSIHTK